MDSLADRSGESFPKALDDAELEGAYRFFGNAKVTPDAILAPHFRQTARRAAAHRDVLIIHDTTQFEFGGSTEREGLGRLIRPGQGFFGHFALATSANGDREPLGLLNLETVFRLDKVSAKPRPERPNRGESARWVNSIEGSEAVLDGASRAIHVMDREADSYAVLSALDQAKRSFVIRSFQNRVLADEESRLRETAKAAKRSFDRDVPLSRRPVIDGPKGKRHPARRHRTATLSFAGAAIEIPRTSDAKRTAASTLKLNVIYVFERRPPAGEPPVEWFLLTDLPITTDKSIAFAVDCYRGRWTIEEYFKALKTGCQYEKRQLESAHSLLNALAVLAPVAWRLLLVRHLGRHAPTRPASDALTPSQLAVLQATARRPLPKHPTIQEAMLAIAGLGGHLPRNGDPGWLVLGRGMHDLLLLELGWSAARAKM
ncbi:MAG: IS4 family transposase [Chloroflexota bacterium]|nr:IS4 family transposase [Chloroflexota bacterium]